jgi:hypothetical protein
MLNSNKDALCRASLQFILRTAGSFPNRSEPARRVDHKRRSSGPSFAPIQAQSATIAPYQIAINGGESSGQWNA